MTISTKSLLCKAMKFLSRVERFIEALMSLSTLVGFMSTLYLVWIFISAPPVVSTSTSGIGVGGYDIWKTNTGTIQGIPFFWVFTSLVLLSAGHTYRSAKHLILHLAGKNPITVPQLSHFAPSSHMETNLPTSPIIRQKPQE